MELIRELNWVSDDLVVQLSTGNYLCSRRPKLYSKEIYIIEPMPDDISFLRKGMVIDNDSQGYDIKWQGNINALWYPCYGNISHFGYTDVTNCVLFPQNI